MVLNLDVRYALAIKSDVTLHAERKHILASCSTALLSGLEKVFEKPRFLGLKKLKSLKGPKFRFFKKNWSEFIEIIFHFIF